MISRTMTIVMPTDDARIHALGDFPSVGLGSGMGVTIPAGDIVELGGLYISDSNFYADPLGNPMPAGTTIAFLTDNGEIVAGGPWTVGSATAPTGPYNIILKGDDTPSSGILRLEVTSREVTTIFLWDITD